MKKKGKNRYVIGMHFYKKGRQKIWKDPLSLGSLSTLRSSLQTSNCLSVTLSSMVVSLNIHTTGKWSWSYLPRFSICSQCATICLCCKGVEPVAMNIYFDSLAIVNLMSSGHRLALIVIGALMYLYPFFVSFPSCPRTLTTVQDHMVINPFLHCRLILCETTEKKLPKIFSNFLGLLINPNDV